MILPAHFAKLAANRRATVALIPIRQPRTVTRGGKLGWKVPRPGKGTTYETTPWTPQVGSHETLRSSTGRKISTVCDIVIGPHQTIRLADLLVDTPDTLKLVRATGCKTRAELAREWMRHTDPDWPPTEEQLCERCVGDNRIVVEWTNPITTITHVDTTECPDCEEVGTIQVETFPDDPEILERFKARHGHRQVHLVHFALDAIEHRRLLSPAGRPRGDDLGYTENPSDAIQDAGEAIPATLQATYARKAFDRDKTQRDHQLQAGETGGDLDSGRLARNGARADAHRRAA